MNLLFELSKEHPTLPTAEVLACLQAENIEYTVVESNDDVLVIETDVTEKIINRIADRLSLTFCIDEVMFSSPPSIEKITELSLDHAIKRKGTVAIRYKNRSKTVDSQPIIKALAAIYTRERTVTLEKPDIEIRGYITESTVYVGLKKVEVNRVEFEKRKVQHRPFFSPISLHPRLARVLVNLSGIQKDEMLLDPFCGTGGILLEAGLIGAHVVGSDIDKKMIEGCRKTLDFYNIQNYELFCSDIEDIPRHMGMVDAVVTDLPYGKSTTTKGEKIVCLYERAFLSIAQLLKHGKRAIVGLSNSEMISLGERHLEVVEIHELRAHRSLTRYFVVFQKEP